ncbi:hypothetical protein COCMIDRAFT_89967, partial [Bipolaris oryzae ATCC 44560]
GKHAIPIFLVEAEPQMFQRKTAAGTLTVWCLHLFFLLFVQAPYSQSSPRILRIRDTMHHAATFCGTLT